MMIKIKAFLFFILIHLFVFQPRVYSQPMDSYVNTIDRSFFIENLYNYPADTNWTYLGDKPAVVDFYADWSNACRIMQPMIDQFSVEYADDIRFYKIHVEKNARLTKDIEVTGIPAFLFCPSYGEPYLIRGSHGKTAFKNYLETLLQKSR